MNCPKADEDTDCRRPFPSQRGQRSGLVPGAAPAPWQVSHTVWTRSEACAWFLAPPPELDLHLGEEIRAARGAPAPRGAHAPEQIVAKKTEKRSAMLAKSKSVGRKPPVHSPSCPKRS